MKTILEAMKAYLETHPFDSGSDDCATVLDQLYLAYANSHESDPPEIRKGFEELEDYPLLITMPSVTSFVGFAVHTNAKLSWMVCNTALN